MKVRNPRLFPLTALAVLLGIAVLLIALASCGGGDDGDNSEAVAWERGGPVACERLANDSYKYTAVFEFTVDSPEPKPTGVPQGPSDSHFKQDVTGEVEDNDSYKARIKNDPGGTPYEYGIVKDNGRSWLEEPTGWDEENVEGPRGGSLVPLLPVNICQALAPDLDTNIEAQSEDIHGAESLRFEAAPLTSDFPERLPDIGPQSDISALVNDFNGAVWVAESGGYVTKVELTGTGQYEDGTTLNVTISYEISEMGTEIDVDPPI